MLKMKREHRDKWLAALRSGEYEQTTGALHDKNGYCCLGVFCDVMFGRDHWKHDSMSVDPKKFQSHGRTSYLPEQAAALVGGSDRPTIVGVTLSHYNDCGYTFFQIANLIEMHCVVED